MEDSPVTYIELTIHPGDVFPNPESDAEQEADIAAYFDVLSAALHKAFPKAEIIIINERDVWGSQGPIIRHADEEEEDEEVEDQDQDQDIEEVEDDDEEDGPELLDWRQRETDVLRIINDIELDLLADYELWAPPLPKADPAESE